MDILIEKTGAVKCEIVKAGPCGIVIFGASGDLAQRKLIPALYNIFKNHNVPENFFVLGFARSKISEKQFRKKIADAAGTGKSNGFIERCSYISGDYSDDNDYKKLKKKIAFLAEKYKTCGNIIFNLAVPPKLYPFIAEKLSINKLMENMTEVQGSSTAADTAPCHGINKPFTRIMIEKPFGRDYDTAAALNRKLVKFFDEKQIYRIDHYLGKETVQNILVFRFANAMFEPLWNSRYIDNIQIIVTEELGVGTRAGYFDSTGIIRDMLQNHMMQLLALIAMEQPEKIEAEAIRDKKNLVFNSIRPFDMTKIDEQVIRAQYKSGETGIAYRKEKGVLTDSCTETFFAAKMFMDNKRWQGMPFYLKAGKKLDKKETKIVVNFKDTDNCILCGHDTNLRSGNVLVFSIHPDQGIDLGFLAKLPGTKMCPGSLNMKFRYKEHFGFEAADDYETIVLDCMQGDQTLFWRRDGVESVWKLLTPVLKNWESCSVKEKKSKLYQYAAGSRGPEQADQFIEKDQRKWL